MLKIIECFSVAPIVRITMHFNKIGEEIDENDVVVNTTITDFSKHISVPLLQSKNPTEIAQAMSDAKLKYIEQDGYLFLISNESDRFGIRFVPEVVNEKLYKIRIENNVIYGGNDKISYNPDILEKMEQVYKQLETDIDDHRRPIAIVINAIRRSYKNTGIISRDDLKWLNKIHKEFK